LTTDGNTAMTWSELNLNQIDTAASSSTPAEIPTGNYKLRLVGAKPNPYREGETDIDFVVVEGQYTKRHVFTSLPKPGSYTWVIPAAALLIQRLGIEQQPGEDLVDTLSRGAANGAGLITADVQGAQEYTAKDGQVKMGRPKFQFFSVAAAV
jgi:hypothetical protein